MPKLIQFFAQAISLAPDHWSTAEQITSRFHSEGHKNYFLNTIVSFVMSLYDILHLWRIRVVDGEVGPLSSLSIKRLYPLSPLLSATLGDIVSTLESRKESQAHHVDTSWQNFRVVLGKPGTGKCQVLIRAITHDIQQDMSVLVAAPVALLAQAYTKIFQDDIEADTLHGAFNIPVDGTCSDDINYALNKFDMIGSMRPP